MKLPDTLQETPEGFVSVAEDIIHDFTGFRKVKVSSTDPEMVGAEPNCCIDNSIALAEYGDLEVVQGYITLDQEDPKLGIFHYWNYCPETNRYWDSTPLNKKFRYYIKS